MNISPVRDGGLYGAVSEKDILRRLEITERERDAFKQELYERERYIGHLLREIENARAAQIAILQTTSWKVTAPLRFLVIFARRAVGAARRRLKWR